MEILLFCLNILICFSALLDQVRKEVVYKAILELPLRETVDILKMLILMSKAKENYSMTESESAYFAYLWIGENIQIDCYGIAHGTSSSTPLATYKEGKGGENGITSLFNLICEYLDIESNIISGIKKMITPNITQIIQIKDYAWNSVSINNEYYLIDVVSGIGECNYRNELILHQRDNYFGINPEQHIRFRFPNDEKWQLISKPITREQFKSQALLGEGFVKYFKTISPDIQTLKNQEYDTITLTFEQSIEKIFYYTTDYSLDEPGNNPIINEGEAIVINGTCKIPLKHSEGSGYIYFDISINSPVETKYYLAIYEYYN